MKPDLEFKIRMGLHGLPLQCVDDAYFVGLMWPKKEIAPGVQQVLAAAQKSAAHAGYHAYVDGPFFMAGGAVRMLVYFRQPGEPVPELENPEHRVPEIRSYSKHGDRIR